jgi:hypothetical protein
MQIKTANKGIDDCPKMTVISIPCKKRKRKKKKKQKDV